MFQTVFFYINCLCVILICAASCYASEPMVIDINEGIEDVPFEVGDVDRGISSSFVNVININELPETLLDITQVIERSSGIQVKKTGGLGSYSSVSIRGKSSDQITVYIWVHWTSGQGK